MPLRILHISDLHERAAFVDMPESRKAKLDWDARERGLILGDKLHESLREISKDGVDFTCFTGDVADWGHPNEYAKATDRLKKILDAVHVPLNGLFVVPGNHDVQRDVHPEAWKGIREWHDRTGNGSALGRWLASVDKPPPGIEPEWRDAVAERKAAFWRWTKEFGCADIQPSESTPLGYRHTFDIGTLSGIDVPIHIIGLDSAWLCGGDDEHGRILLTEEQVLAHVRDGEHPLDGFRIALVHHPLTELADQRDVWGLLAENVDVVLHGHQHSPLVSLTSVPGANLRTLAAGCLIEGDLGRNWPNGFQLIEVDVASKSYTVHFRKWARDASPRFWAKGSDIYCEAPAGVLRFVTRPRTYDSPATKPDGAAQKQPTSCDVAPPSVKAPPERAANSSGARAKGLASVEGDEAVERTGSDTRVPPEATTARRGIDLANMRSLFPELTPTDVVTLTRLGRVLHSGRAALFVGARVPQASGLPNREQQRSRIVELLGADLATLSAACDEFAKRIGRHALREEMVSIFDDWNKPLTPLHLLVSRLNVRCIITSTPDRLLEEAFRLARRQHIVLSWPEDVRYGRPDLPTLLKIRGTLEHPHTLVLSSNDEHDRWEKPLFREALRQLLAERAFLAVGVEEEESDLDSLLGAVGDDLTHGAGVSLHASEEDAAPHRNAHIRTIVLKERNGLDFCARSAQLIAILSGIPVNEVPTVQRPMDRRANPFRRLEPYRDTDSPRFFGRVDSVERVHAALSAHRVLLLFGESGVGKTSFLQAGLIPIERKTGVTVIFRTVLPDLSATWQTILTHLPVQQPTLLILDQLERFFDGTRDQEVDRRRFLCDTLPNCLERLPRLRILLSIRRDRLYELHRYKQVFPGLYHESIELPPLSRAAVVDVLMKKFGLAGYSLPEAVLRDVVNRSSQDSAPFLPALQLFGHALFEWIETQRLLGEDVRLATVPEELHLRELESFVGDSVRVIAAGENRAILLRVLRRLTLHGRRQSITPAQLKDEFPDPSAARSVLHLLVDRRLVRLVDDRAYELVHDSLVPAIETGPLASDEHLDNSDILAYYLNDQRRAQLNVEQCEGILRYSVREQLSLAPWLSALEGSGVRFQDALVDLCRDPDARVSTSAVRALGKYMDAQSLLDERQYLISVVAAAMWEEEPAEKGLEALRILLLVGLDGTELEVLLDIVDPHRHLETGIELPGARTLTQQDREFLKQLLPELVRSITSDDLCAMADTGISHLEFELGSVGYATVLTELGRRGLAAELLARFDALWLSRSHDLEGEPILLSLADMPDSFSFEEVFDDYRRAAVEAFIDSPMPRHVLCVARLLSDLGRCDAEWAMRKWLSQYSRFTQDETLWSTWRDTGSKLVENSGALRLLLERVSLTFSPADTAGLWAVVLYAEPSEAFANAESEFRPELRALLVGLSANGVDSVLRGGLERLSSGQLLGGSALGAWRHGEFVASRQDVPLSMRVQALEELRRIVEASALRVAARALGKVASSDDRLVNIEPDWEVAIITEVRELVRRRRERLLSALERLSARLSKVKHETEAAHQLMHWLSVLTLISPDLTSPAPFWPPLGLPVDLIPIRRALTSAESAAMEEETIRGPVGEVVDAFRQWCDSDILDLPYRIAVVDWLRRRTAELVADEGTGEWEETMKGWVAQNPRQDRAIPVSPLNQSAIRWAFRAPAANAPWFAMLNDPREGEVDDEELRWLFEAMLVSCNTPPDGVVRGWAEEYVSECLSTNMIVYEEEPGLLLRRVCESTWVVGIGKRVSAEQVERLLESPVFDTRSAALLIWAETQFDEFLERVARLSLSLDGPRSLRETARNAIDRWFLLRTMRD